MRENSKDNSKDNRKQYDDRVPLDTLSLRVDADRQRQVPIDSVDELGGLLSRVLYVSSANQRRGGSVCSTADRFRFFCSPDAAPLSNSVQWRDVALVGGFVVLLMLHHQIHDNE